MDSPTPRSPCLSVSRGIRRVRSTSKENSPLPRHATGPATGREITANRSRSSATLRRSPSPHEWGFANHELLLRRENYVASVGCGGSRIQHARGISAGPSVHRNPDERYRQKREHRRMSLSTVTQERVKVLIVDDNEDQRNLLRRHFEIAGCEVTDAATAESAIS